MIEIKKIGKALNLIQEIHNYLSGDIQAMNEVIVDSLSVEEELIKVVSKHLSTTGGKRMRPILTILSAKMLGYEGEQSIKLAAAVEFIHMATLLHDDVVDGSKMRRFLPTANVIWGSKASILVGDFLFSQSFKLMVSTKIMSALSALSNASAIIAQGEVSQLVQLEEQRLVKEEEYLAVINSKTAELFGAACEVGGIVAGREDVAQNLKNFGLCLGNIFQIADDALDYFSESNKVGKNIGDDFYEGKITLPVILLARKISDKDSNKLKLMIESKDRSEDDFNWIKLAMNEHNIQADIKTYLDRLKISALNSLSKINVKNKPKEYLESLVDFAINRSY